MSLIWLAFLLAIIDWWVLFKQKIGWEIWSKPLVMVGLILWYANAVGISNLFTVPYIFVLLAIVFSLAGDVFLLTKIDKFILGLVSFLVAHVFYILAMTPFLFDSNETLALVLLALITIPVGWTIIRAIVMSLISSGKEKLKIPVIVYGIVLLTTLFLSIRGLSSAPWRGNQGIYLALGGFLFFLSDLILAWNRFVEEINNGRFINRILYHLGQIGLVAAFILHYSR